MAFDKPFLDLDKQLNLLESRNLIITNRDRAKQPTKYYLKYHNHVPPWILFKNISFGSAINIFRLLSTKHKREVANLLLPTDLITCKDKIEIKDTSNKVEVLDKFDIIVVKDEIERIKIWE